MPENYKKYRCTNCNKTLFFGEIQDGIISVDCLNSKCRHRNIFEVKNGRVVNEEKEKVPLCRIHAECKRERVPCKFRR